MAEVVEAGETVLGAVVREAVVVEAGENVDLGRPQQSDQLMKDENLLRMRSIMKRIAFRRSCVSRQAIEVTEENHRAIKPGRVRLSTPQMERLRGLAASTAIDSGA